MPKAKPTETIRARARVLGYRIFGGVNVIMTSIGINFLFVGLGAIVWSYSSRQYRFCSNFLQAMWIDGVSYGLEAPELVISGDIPESVKEEDGGAIIISNHTVDYDWYCLWLLGRTWGFHGLMKIILKDSLKDLPIFGWGMQYFEFIFLARNWATDKHNLYKQLRSFVSDDVKLWLLLFPEGTTMNQEVVEKSRQFAKEQGRPEFDKHVLSPRSRGFEACVDAMSAGKPCVYDITIAYDSYSGELVPSSMGYTRNIDVNIPSMAKLTSGEKCPYVHFHIKKIPYDEVIKQNPEKFLDDLWVEKYNRLERFTKLNKFADEDTGGNVVHKTVEINPFSVIFCWATAIVGLTFLYWCLSYHQQGFFFVMIPFFVYRLMCRQFDWDYGKFGETSNTKSTATKAKKTS